MDPTKPMALIFFKSVLTRLKLVPWWGYNQQAFIMHFKNQNQMLVEQFSLFSTYYVNKLNSSVINYIVELLLKFHVGLE